MDSGDDYSPGLCCLLIALLPLSVAIIFSTAWWVIR